VLKILMKADAEGLIDARRMADPLNRVLSPLRAFLQVERCISRAPPCNNIWLRRDRRALQVRIPTRCFVVDFLPDPSIFIELHLDG
jgi:hypothetical protein